MNISRILLAALASLALLVGTSSALIGPPGTVRGSTVRGISIEDALVCEAPDLEDESKALLDRWVELDRKSANEGLTEEEYMEVKKLYESGTCINIQGDLHGTVVLLDGHYYLVDYCVQGGICARVIQKSKGFQRQ